MSTPEHAAYDVVVVGGGPGGAVAAAICAAGGLRTLVLERSIFPREKVCGDCVNPNCWEVFDRLGIADRVRALPHAVIREICFIGEDRVLHPFELPAASNGELAVKRAELDHLLLRRAAELGAEVCEDSTVHSVSMDGGVVLAKSTVRARFVLGADGRNSIVARSCGCCPSIRSDRIGVQTHVPLPEGYANRIELQFLADGYCGVADVGSGTLNLCLVTRPSHLARMKHWAERTFRFSPDRVWRTVTPLARTPNRAVNGRVLLVGDAARVVEPFTGEGIYYAMKSGLLAAESILAHRDSNDPVAVGTQYTREHERLYRGRLWVNSFARIAVTRPAIARIALRAARVQPALLAALTRKVIGQPVR